MSSLSTAYGTAPQNWLQHHLPWLVMLTLLTGMFRDEPTFLGPPDDLNG